MERQKSLKALNTFHVDVTANYFTTVNSVQDAQSLLKQPELGQLTKLVLGGGSNILFTQDFPGLVIKNDIRGIDLILENDEYVWLTVGAGENWHPFVLHCIDNHYAGIENLSLIPGTVGAAPVQNIGAYGVELSSVLESLQAISLTDGSIRHFTNPECQFGYRDSIFKNTLKNKFLITYVTLKLQKNAKPITSYGAIDSTLAKQGITTPTIKNVSDAIITIRSQKLPDPAITPNAGSFFKNPIIKSTQFDALRAQFPDIPHYPQTNNQIKIPAAWLIDQCELKGYKDNGVGISPNHALVIVNYESTSGRNIYALSQMIQGRVAKKFQIQLETEVNIV